MIDMLSPLIKKFLPFAQERMGFDKPPRLFLKGDADNAKNPLGKTAFYDPDSKSVTIYITGRHPKDVMRSLSHELVHHSQNCRGDFSDSSNMGQGYAQKDEHLREMEREAYEVGNMCFRDWEDSLKSTIYFEHLQKGEKKMSIKDWKNNEISGLLAEAWGFKFNTLQEFDEFNESGELQAEGEEEDLDEVAGVATKSQDRRTPRLQKDRKPAPEREDDEKVDEGEDVQDEDPAGATETEDGVVSEKQGYDARLDDTLGAKHGKKSQSEKDREHESEGEEEAHGKGKYAGDSQMDESDDVDLEEKRRRGRGGDARNARGEVKNDPGARVTEDSPPALNKEAIRDALREVLLSLKS